MSKKTKKTILAQKHSQRDAFWTKVGTLMRSDSRIAIVVADMSTPVFDTIRKEFPHRFFNVGIAEQNAILISSGLAKEGKKVFVYAIGSFMVLRCYEQIRVENSIMGLPVTIVGVGSGFSYDDSGPTHHLFEDIALMRVLPNMTIHSVTDNVMAAEIAKISTTMTTPNYVRLERHVEPDIYSEDTDYSKGISVLRQGEDGLIVSMGIMVRKSLAIAKKLKKQGISLGVIDMHTIPCDKNAFIDIVSGYDRIISIEENFLSGGLGSYLLELISDIGLSVRVKRFGLNPAWCYRYGGREDNRAYHGLDEPSLLKATDKYFKQ